MEHEMIKTFLWWNSWIQVRFLATENLIKLKTHFLKYKVIYFISSHHTYLTRLTDETLKITINPLVNTKIDRKEHGKPSSKSILLIAKRQKLRLTYAVE